MPKRSWPAAKKLSGVLCRHFASFCFVWDFCWFICHIGLLFVCFDFFVCVFVEFCFCLLVCFLFCFCFKEREKA